MHLAKVSQTPYYVNRSLLLTLVADDGMVTPGWDEEGLVTSHPENRGHLDTNLKEMEAVYIRPWRASFALPIWVSQLSYTCEHFLPMGNG